MKVGTTVVLFLTVLAGVVVLGCWADPQRSTVDRRSFILASIHGSVALLAGACWILALTARSVVLERLATGALAVTAVLGASTYVSSRIGQRSGRFPDAPVPVPRLALIVHGGAAVALVALAVITSAGA